MKDALIVRVTTDDSFGWSECTAQATPTYSPDTIDTERVVIRDELAPRLFTGAGFDDVRGHHAAKAAVTGAVLDARLRAEGTPLAAHLGGVGTHVTAGVAVGMADDLGSLRSRVAAYVAAGYRSVKLKIAPGHDVSVVAAVRAEIGSDVMLQVDANGSYTLAKTEHLEHLRQLDAFGLACIEQPLAPDAILDHVRLAEHQQTRLALDETITSASVARDVFTLGACRVISIKSGLVGGLDEAIRTLDACRAAGADARAGGMVETGIGRAALIALASVPGFTVTGDLSASGRYFDEDLTEPFDLDDGSLAVPTGPGLGVEPRLDVLARCTVAHERLEPAR